MSHELMGERFAGFRVPGWHKLGKTFEEAISVSEAMKLVNMFFQIHKVPLYAAIAEVDGSTAQQLIDKVALMREPTADFPEWKNLGVVGPDYGLIQNAEIAAMLEPLSDIWPVETVGALGQGETLFVTLRVESVDVAGEEVKMYVLFTDTRDGFHKAEFHVTGVRVVCKNTLNMGTATSIVSADVKHTAGAKAELQWRTEMLGKLQKSVTDVKGEWNALAKATLSAGQFDAVLNAAYPLPKVPKAKKALDAMNDEQRALTAAIIGDQHSAVAQFEAACARAVRWQEAAKENFALVGQTSPGIAGTAWAAYNAVVEMQDWGGRDDDRVTVSALVGPRADAKERAYAQVLKAL